MEVTHIRDDHELEAVLDILRKIPGLGNHRIKILVEGGFDSIGKLEEADSESLIKVNGIGKSTAEKILRGLDASRDADGHIKHHTDKEPREDAPVEGEHEKPERTDLDTLLCDLVAEEMDDEDEDLREFTETDIEELLEREYSIDSNGIRKGTPYEHHTAVGAPDINEDISVDDRSMGEELMMMPVETDDFRNKIARLELELNRFDGREYEEYKMEIENIRNHPGSEVEQSAKLESLLEKMRAKSKREMEEFIEQKVSELQMLLNIAIRLSVPLNREKKIISEAVASSKTGDSHNTIYLLSRARENVKDSIWEPLWKELRVTEENVIASGDKDLKARLAEAKEAIIHGDYERSDKLLLEIRKRTTTFKMEGEIVYLREIIEFAASIGVDCSKCKTYLERASDTNKHFLYIERARINLSKSLPSKLHDAVKVEWAELERKKRRGIDTSKGAALLKKAILEMRKKEYIAALEYVREFHRAIKH